MRFRGFTLVEILTVLAITLVLYSVLTPIFISVKTQAKETNAKHNLRQIFVATALYRMDWEQTSYGTASNMGIPLLEQIEALPVPFSMLSKSPCVAPENGPLMWSPDNSKQFETDSLKYEERATLVIDMNCNPKGTPLNSKWFPIKGFATTIGGNLRVVRKPGDWHDDEWWQP